MEQTTNQAQQATRPKFLTILTILSFIGIAISIVMNILSYFTYKATASVAAVAGADAIVDAVGLNSGKWATVVLIQALLNLPILAGVLLMFKQKKLGYYIYAPFEIIQAALPLIMGLGLLGGLSAIVSIVIAIVFVVLYALNLKSMYDFKKEFVVAEKTPTANVIQQKQAVAPVGNLKPGTVFYEIRLSNVSCTAVGATFKVGMTVTAKKFVVDIKTGKEKEEVINDEIQIGMVKAGKEIYLKSYRFTKTVTALSLTLDQKPDKIGVDPYNKLPERA
ncbi:MAG: hypothetical protein WBM13_12870 [Bacteroidia bacterium]